jgi:NAD(P)-dependent dehydrogenase (short-subunit alcohol dehydrogenase family)
MANVADGALETKTALVTGASRGIGEAIARGLARHGADVALVSRNQPDLDRVAEAINRDGRGRAVAMACHTGDTGAIGELFSRVEETFGGLDVLVNNAATNPYFGPALDNPEAAFDKTVEVNVKGYFTMAQHAARSMVTRGSGSIINISSIAGLSPMPNMVIYSMTKAAVISLTKGLAKELGSSGVRVNAIAPGVIDTKFAAALINDPAFMKATNAMTPLGRPGQPEEIVGAALYLASDASSYTTGSVIVCDGGTTA